MSTVTVCDHEDCGEWATLFVRVTDSEHTFQGLEFDACSFAHAEQHLDGLILRADAGEFDEEEAK